jgi:hypothetical protein
LPFTPLLRFALDSRACFDSLVKGKTGMAVEIKIGRQLTKECRFGNDKTGNEQFLTFQGGSKRIFSKYRCVLFI